MDQVMVQVEVDVNPTESLEKVKKALWNIFGELPLEEKPLLKGILLISETKSQSPLLSLRNALRRDHIRDAARRVLRKGLREGVFTFYLNKQVAYAGHVSFSEAEAESPLGPIRVTVHSETPLQLLDWLAPKTSKE